MDYIMTMGPTGPALLHNTSRCEDAACTPVEHVYAHAFPDLPAVKAHIDLAVATQRGGDAKTFFYATLDYLVDFALPSTHRLLSEAEHRDTNPTYEKAQLEHDRAQANARAYWDTS